MANRRVLVDTSLFIEHLRARDKTTTNLYRLAGRNEVETSAIVAAEIFYGARQSGSEEHAAAVLRPFPVHPFTVEMASLASGIAKELRKKNQMLDLRDVMIAATAIELELPITTLNRAHFERISEIELETLPDAGK